MRVKVWLAAALLIRSNFSEETATLIRVLAAWHSPYVTSVDTAADVWSSSWSAPPPVSRWAAAMTMAPAAADST